MASGGSAVDWVTTCGQNGCMPNVPSIMIPATPEKRRSRHSPEQTRQEILMAAQAHIQSHGFAAMSMSGLARQLGMSTANIHKHFRSREGLAEAVCGLELSRFVAYIENQAFAGEGTQAAFRLFAAALLSYHQNNTTLTPYMFDLYVVSAQSDWTVFRAFRCDMVNVLEQILQKGLLRGDVRPEAMASAEQVFDGFASVMHPLLIRDFAELGSERGQRLADFLYLAIAPPGI